MVLLQQVARSLVGHFLDRFHAVEREPMQSLPGLNVEYDALADFACSLSRHQTAFLARFFAAGGGVFCFLAGAFPQAPSPMLRFRASIRLTTLLGFLLAFACLHGLTRLLGADELNHTFSYRSSTSPAHTCPDTPTARTSRPILAQPGNLHLCRTQDRASRSFLQQDNYRLGAVESILTHRYA